MHGKGFGAEVIGQLSGYTIGVTADRRAAEQIELFERRGASVLYGPTIRTHPLGAEVEVEAATRAVIDHPPAFTVLSTGVGVRAWLDAADSLGLAADLVEALNGSVILARGPKASGAAVTAGLDVRWQTPNGTIAEVVAELEARCATGRPRVAFQLDGAMTASLASSGLDLDVIGVPVYRWTLPADAQPALRLVHAVIERRVDAITFTARPQIENICELAEAHGCLERLRRALSGPVVVACVGPVCASGATEAGFEVAVVPSRYRLGSLVLAVVDHFASLTVDFELCGRSVQLQGRLALVDGEAVLLTERERDVLRALVGRGGIVASKQELLAEVWENEADGHVVEVTVARLRNRLGCAGQGIETVVKRGYRLAVA